MWPTKASAALRRLRPIPGCIVAARVIRSVKPKANHLLGDLVTGCGPSVEAGLGPRVQGRLQFPGQGYGVLNPGVHPLSAGGAVNVGCVVTQQAGPFARRLRDAVLNAEARAPDHARDARGLGLRTAAVEQGLNISNGRSLGRSVHGGHDAKIAAWKRRNDHETHRATTATTTGRTARPAKCRRPRPPRGVASSLTAPRNPPH